MKPWTEAALIPAPAEGTSPKLLEWDTKDIDVLRIGAKGKMKMKKMDTTMIGQEPIFDERNREVTRSSEQWLEHIPDILQTVTTGKASRFDWNYRSLIIGNIDSANHDYPEDAKGYWCMYKCGEPRVGSRLERAWKNPFFWGAEQARAFGDVYVFRVEDIATDRFGRRKFAKSWSMPEEQIARDIFVSLASLDGKEQIKPEKREKIKGKEMVVR